MISDGNKPHPGRLAQSNSHDAEQLRALAHELAEALAATKSSLRAAERLANQEKLREAIRRASEQIDRAGDVVAKLRALVGS